MGSRERGHVSAMKGRGETIGVGNRARRRQSDKPRSKRRVGDKGTSTKRGVGDDERHGRDEDEDGFVETRRTPSQSWRYEGTLGADPYLPGRYIESFLRVFKQFACNIPRG